MNTTLLRTTTSPPPDAVGRLRLIDRAALGIGITLVTWANRSDERHAQRLERRRLRAGHEFELAARRTEREREFARSQSSLLFRNLQ